MVLADYGEVPVPVVAALENIRYQQGKFRCRGRRNTEQNYAAGRRQTPAYGQFTEVLIESKNDSILPLRLIKDGYVSRTRHILVYPGHIMPPGAQQRYHIQGNVLVRLQTHCHVPTR